VNENADKRMDPGRYPAKNHKEEDIMKRVLCSVVLVCFMILGVTCIVQGATADEAKGIVEKAIAYWKANGKEKAVAEFNNPNGQFVKGDLYVFVNDFSGLILANGGNPKLVGQNHLELKDPTGKYFNKESAEVAKTKGSGWVDYSWTNPATKKVQQKAAWVKRIDGTNIYIGSGIWK
jgi:cytochrome c